MAYIVVLGGGLVGNVIAQDMATHHQVSVVDKNTHALKKLVNKKNIHTTVADVTQKNTLYSLIQDADLVITALPGYLAFSVVKNIIEAGKNIVDISFYPENPLSLHSLAQQNNVTAIVDCGVAPGMSNFLLGYHASHMQVDEFICYVGGLPVERKFPFQYKAPFSPSDVIEEYMRPARLKENGKIVIKPALSEIELIDFPGIGTLEAFNTDGLRTLLETMNVPNMKEKTLRYPGHTHIIQALKSTGFFHTSEIEIHGKKIRPIELTTQLLKKAWQLEENEEEFTIMRIVIKGIQNNKPITYVYELLDKYDRYTQHTSMARTTGFTCTAMAHLILEKHFAQKGIFPPEIVASYQGTYQFVMNYLLERSVKYNHFVTTDTHHHHF